LKVVSGGSYDFRRPVHRFASLIRIGCSPARLSRNYGYYWKVDDF
jgi:hypothetical protein